MARCAGSGAKWQDHLAEPARLALNPFYSCKDRVVFSRLSLYLSVLYRRSTFHFTASYAHNLLDELGRKARKATLLLALAFEVHLHGHLGGSLHGGLLAGTGGDLALGGLVVEELHRPESVGEGMRVWMGC